MHKTANYSAKLQALADSEVQHGRPEGCQMNCDNVVEPEYREKSFQELLNSPVTALKVGWLVGGLGLKRLLQGLRQLLCFLGYWVVRFGLRRMVAKQHMRCWQFQLGESQEPGSRYPCPAFV